MIVDEKGPVGPIVDGDSVILFNFAVIVRLKFRVHLTMNHWIPLTGAPSPMSSLPESWNTTPIKNPE